MAGPTRRVARANPDHQAWVGCYNQNPGKLPVQSQVVAPHLAAAGCDEIGQAPGAERKESFGIRGLCFERVWLGTVAGAAGPF